jgi:sulfate adenylyltransferase subunit 1
MEVLKIATAGSVDDGKSTLIGRILYDTKSLTDDKIEAIEQKSQSKGYDYLDFSLATDGLVAEREQGITIDVAHIYFSTANRSYIIADTPGHVEYTRNMVTGASTSQVSIILIDARKGVIEQTKRHFFINNLLRVKDIVVAVNKMDLVDFDEACFNSIRSELELLAAGADYKNQTITFIPVSALKGDNVVSRSSQTPWYKGKTLMEHLESIENKDVYEMAQARFPVQTVIRPKQAEYHDYRAYAGKLYGNDLSVGDDVTVLPSLTQSKIKEIQFFGTNYDTAKRGSSLTISLENNVNVSRGDLIVRTDEIPESSKQISATICWMDKNPMQATSKYKLQHGTNTVLAKVKHIDSVLEIERNQHQKEVDSLKLNDIGTVSLQLNKALFFDSYSKNKSTGYFILIDSKSNTTAGVGFIN